MLTHYALAYFAAVGLAVHVFLAACLICLVLRAIWPRP